MRTLALFVALLVGFVGRSFATQQPQEQTVAVVLVLDGDDDRKVVATLFTSLMEAEKVAQMLRLDVRMSADVTEGILFFSLKSEEQSQMTLRLFHEDGYQEVAHRRLEVYEGNTYKAVNVDHLEDGSYIFSLTDEQGREHKQRVILNRMGLSL